MEVSPTGSTLISDTSFVGSNAVYGGGAMYLQSMSGPIWLHNVSFTDNYVTLPPVSSARGSASPHLTSPHLTSPHQTWCGQCLWGLPHQTSPGAVNACGVCLTKPHLVRSVLVGSASPNLTWCGQCLWGLPHLIVGLALDGMRTYMHIATLHLHFISDQPLPQPSADHGMVINHQAPPRHPPFQSWSQFARLENKYDAHAHCMLLHDPDHCSACCCPPPHLPECQLLQVNPELNPHQGGAVNAYSW